MLKIKKHLLSYIAIGVIVYLTAWVATFANAPGALTRQITNELHGAQTGSSVRQALYQGRSIEPAVFVTLKSCHAPFIFTAEVKLVMANRIIYGKYLWTPWEVYALSEVVWIAENNGNQ